MYGLISFHMPFCVQEVNTKYETVSKNNLMYACNISKLIFSLNVYLNTTYILCMIWQRLLLGIIKNLIQYIEKSICVIILIWFVHYLTRQDFIIKKPHANLIVAWLQDDTVDTAMDEEMRVEFGNVASVEPFYREQASTEKHEQG
jgi:hypothetical protein